MTQSPGVGKAAAGALMLCAGVVLGGLWAGDGRADPGASAPPQASGPAGGNEVGELAQTLGADAQITRPTEPNRGAITNLPVPRYVSLKGSQGNARRGPSLSHRIDWVFRHAGMPLRVVAEFGHWRRVEDRDGAGGWIHYAMLSGVRTAIIEQDMTELRARPDPDAEVVARAEAGAILRLGECNRDWCRLSSGGQRGWVPKTTFWGADAEEIRE